MKQCLNGGQQVTSPGMVILLFFPPIMDDGTLCYTLLRGDNPVSNVNEQNRDQMTRLFLSRPGKCNQFPIPNLSLSKDAPQDSSLDTPKESFDGRRTDGQGKEGTMASKRELQRVSCGATTTETTWPKASIPSIRGVPQSLGFAKLFLQSKTDEKHDWFPPEKDDSS